MVFDNIGDSIKGLLGDDENQGETQENHNIVDEEFSDIYSSEVVSALENQNYGRAEQLVDSIGMEFGDLIDTYIEDRIASATQSLEYFSERTDEAEQAVKKAAGEIRRVKNKNRRMEGDKLVAKPALSMADSYVDHLNSDDATEAMRESFKALHMAAHAADYVEQREDVELEQYHPQKVKAVASKKVSEMRELDEEMGMDFMVPEYNKLVREYNDL